MSEPPLTSSWCTNWGSFNTPRLWAMVADEDDPDAWRQVAAWGDVATSVKDQRSRLVAAKEALIAAWPPAQNASADAFVTELDDLLTRMDRAHQDADTTASGYANILEALRQAKNQVQPLYEEYKQKNDDWVPGWFDNAEDEIDERARKALIAAEQAVEQNVPSIKVPEPYTMDPNAKSGYTPPTENNAGDGTRYAGGVGSTGSGGGGSYATTSPSSGGHDGGGEIPVPHEPVPPMPGMDPVAPADGGGGGGAGGGSGAGGSGPDLAGVAPLPVTPPVVTPPPGVPPIIGQPIPPAPPPTILPPPIPGVPPAITAGGGAGKPPPNTTFQSVGRSGGRTALPSGAVIGETVGRSGTARAGGVSAGNTRAGGVSAGNTRAGGVSAGSVGRGANASGARTGQKPPRPSWLPPDERSGGRTATSQSAMSGARRGSQPEDETEGRRFDPDNPWEVESGVAPVIKPQTGTPRHDPGPNVIGGYRG